MFHKLSANHPSFKPIIFKPGLNIVLAEKSPESGEKASRNALGKTTFIEILDFCFGADFNKNSKLYSPELIDWAFSLELTISGHHFEMTRYINEPNKIYIIPFDNSFPISLKNSSDKQLYIDLGGWRNFLEKHLFDINNNEDKINYAPTARSILGYFIRKSYLDPFSTIKNQRTVQKQVNNAFVLNLLWDKSLELNNIQNDLKQTTNILQYYKSSGNSQGKLNSQITTLSKELERLRKDISTFNVLPEYRNIQKEANELTKNIQDLNNTVICDKRKLKEYYSVIEDENISEDITSVIAMYNEIKVVFNKSILKTLDDVKKFNEAIVKNRKDFLKKEIDELEKKIDSYNEKIKEYSDLKIEKMKILSAHGALDEYSILQENLNKKAAFLESLRIDAEKQKKAQDEKIKIKSQQESVKYTISQDIISNETLKEEISLFNDNSMELYDMSANLVVDTNKNGNYKYYIDRPKTSEGIDHMDILCYDLMLIEMRRKNCPDGIDFLIHDSTLYDAVDSRQRAKAIELANKKSNQCGFQYIFTINSDLLPVSDFSSDFNYKNFVIRELTDKNPTTSLLGIIFSSPLDEDSISNIEE